MRNLFLLVAVLVAILLPPNPSRGEALAKLEAKKLAAISQAVQDLRADWKAVPRAEPYREYRANLHVHSHWSHDSRGKIEQIVVAAKAAGTSVLMFTEHPAEHYDFFKDGHAGMKDGVLLIPGAETEGFLVYPTMSLPGVKPATPQEFSDLVRGRGGLMFVSHLEERMDWNIRGVTGVEIYNTHADFKDEKKLVAALKNPLWLLQATELFRKYPQESFSALQDYPADYLKRWDELCQTAPHTGVSANDAHQNIGLTIRWGEGDKARIEDALGKKLIDLDFAFIPGSDAWRKDKKVGDELYRLLLDPYEVSLKHVGTHLLLMEGKEGPGKEGPGKEGPGNGDQGNGLNEKAVREALEAGRAFVAFDWLADSTGFDFAAVAESKQHEMGSQVTFSGELTLRGQSPLPVHWRLVRNGKVIEESDGRTLEYKVAEPGNYRAEAWLEVAGERMIWVLSNPVYVGK